MVLVPSMIKCCTEKKKNLDWQSLFGNLSKRNYDDDAEGYRGEEHSDRLGVIYYTDCQIRPEANSLWNKDLIFLAKEKSSTTSSVSMVPATIKQAAIA